MELSTEVIGVLSESCGVCRRGELLCGNTKSQWLNYRNIYSFILEQRNGRKRRIQNRNMIIKRKEKFSAFLFGKNNSWCEALFSFYSAPSNNSTCVRCLSDFSALFAAIHVKCFLFMCISKHKKSKMSTTFSENRMRVK